MIIYGIKHLVIEDNTSMGNYESPWTWEILSDQPKLFNGNNDEQTHGMLGHPISDKHS